MYCTLIYWGLCTNHFTAHNLGDMPLDLTCVPRLLRFQRFSRLCTPRPASCCGSIKLNMAPWVARGLHMILQYMTFPFLLQVIMIKTQEKNSPQRRCWDCSFECLEHHLGGWCWSCWHFPSLATWQLAEDVLNLAVVQGVSCTRTWSWVSFASRPVTEKRDKNR